MSGDPTNNGSASANFADLQFAGGTLFGSGATEGAVAFNLGTRRYDDRVENEDDERSTYDLDVAFTMSRSFSPSFEVNTLINANYGDHGSMGDGYVRSGLQIEPVFDWNTRTSFNYRLDGLEIGSKGWGYSTYYHTHGFVESGSDERDSISIAVGQEVRSTLDNGVTVYLDGQYGVRNFDLWTMYDSSFYSVSAGVRTGGPDWSMDASVGWQQYEYDDLNEKNDNLTAQLYYDRMLTANLGLSIKASYGVQELFPNEGGTFFVNPVGTRLASRLNWAFNDKVDVGLSFSVMDVDSEFSGDYSVHRGAVGLDSTIRINDDWSLDPSIVWVNYENDPTVDEDFVVGRLGVARSF